MQYALARLIEVSLSSLPPLEVHLNAMYDKIYTYQYRKKIYHIICLSQMNEPSHLFFSFSRIKFLNVTVGEGDAVMNIDVLESCSAAEMFSDCRRSSEGAEGFAVASTCDWTQSEWGRRSGEFIQSNACVFQISISRRVDHG